jgi:tyrosine-protein phosphatase SIW14
MSTLPDPQELKELIIKSASTRDEPSSPIASSASSSRSVEGSVEASGPPTPVNGPPQNSDIVATGLYRSSFPRSSNFDHLNTLGLKTIITLVPGPYPPEFTAFVELHDIVHYEIPFPAHKLDTDSIPPESMMRVLDLLLDNSNYPLLIHCNKGKVGTP